MSFVSLNTTPFYFSSPFFPLHFGGNAKPSDPDIDKLTLFNRKAVDKLRQLPPVHDEIPMETCAELARLSGEILLMAQKLPSRIDALSTPIVEDLQAELLEAWNKRMDGLSSQEASNLYDQYRSFLTTDMATSLRTKIMRRNQHSLVQAQYVRPLEDSVTQWFRKKTDDDAIRLGTIYGDILFDNQAANDFPGAQRAFWKAAYASLISKADIAWGDVIDTVSKGRAEKLLESLAPYKGSLVYSSLADKAGIRVSA